MIRPLRQCHRHMVITLGFCLPLAFVVCVAARKSVPTINELPAALVVTAQKFAVIEWERTDLFTKLPIEVHLLREQKGVGRFAIELYAAKDFVKPDLIVYWVAGSPEITGALPGNATLLGEFGSTVLPLPPEATTGNGALVLYSLADNEVVDVSKFIRFNDSTN